MLRTKPMLLLITIALLLTSNVLGEGIPRIIDYQGRLTDSVGIPYPSGEVMMTFTIYDDLSKPLWSSDKQMVPVTDGLFNYPLGFNEPLPDDLFDADSVRWLGIAVDDQVEFAPRVRLVSSPFAFHALRADTAMSIDVDTLRIGSLEHSGVINLVGNEFGDEDVCVRIREGDVGGGRIDLYHPGSEASGSAVHLSTDNDGTGGVLHLGSEPHSGDGVVLEGSYYTNQEPYFRMYGPGDDFCVDLNLTDKDSTVRLPRSSVSSSEMYNEPGCGHRLDTVWEYFSEGTFSTLASRSMLFPTDGYAVVIGTARFHHNHIPGHVSSYDFGISTSSSSWDENYTYRWRRDTDWVDLTTDEPLTIHRYFEVSAGLNVFYFLAHANSIGGWAATHRAQLTVMFFPTNYEFNITPPGSE